MLVMKDRNIRIIVFLLTMLSTALFPWWISGFFIFFSVLYFPLYIEALFFSFILDMSYSPALGYPYMLSLGTFIVLVLSVLIKSQIRK